MARAREKERGREKESGRGKGRGMGKRKERGMGKGKVRKMGKGKVRKMGKGKVRKMGKGKERAMGRERAAGREREGRERAGGRPMGGGKAKESEPQLDSATLSYCSELDKALKQQFDTEEEKLLFTSNVLMEIRGKEAKLCTDPKASVFLENLLKECDGSALRSILSAIVPHQAQLGYHRCGAHVLQTALLQVARLQGSLQEQKEEEEGEGGGSSESLESLVLKLSRGVRASFLEYAEDVHGSFVLRTLLQVLGGAVPSVAGGEQGPSKKSARGLDPRGEVVEFEVPEDFLDELRSFAELLEEKENLQVFLASNIASLVFQVGIQVLSRRLPAAARHLCSTVLESWGASEQTGKRRSLLVFLKDKTGSRLLEQVIVASDQELFGRLCDTQLEGRLLELALHPIANYTLQRALASAPTPPLFSKLFHEILLDLEVVVAKGHLGVVVELAAGCVRHREGQDKLLGKLYQIFHCDKPTSRRTSCLSLFVSLQTYEVFHSVAADGASTDLQPSDQPLLRSVNYHGSLLVQNLLRFDRPDELVGSFVDTPAEDLLTLACDPAGKYVFDALFRSSLVPGKRKKAVARKFQPVKWTPCRMTTLAVTLPGISHCPTSGTAGKTGRRFSRLTAKSGKCLLRC
ncbi:nucleolar protein 9 isoform X2 [Narcine bancroftii]|uniref:nucleolar protein 9 isoform X2 n=1 Tax=Narcine bancroftii TaxID=1343680 RepID=UPI003831CBDA